MVEMICQEQPGREPRLEGRRRGQSERFRHAHLELGWRRCRGREKCLRLCDGHQLMYTLRMSKVSKWFKQAFPDWSAGSLLVIFWKKKNVKKVKTDSLNPLGFSVVNSSLHVLPRRAAYDLGTQCRSISRYAETLLSGKHGFPNPAGEWIRSPRTGGYLRAG